MLPTFGRACVLYGELRVKWTCDVVWYLPDTAIFYLKMSCRKYIFLPRFAYQECQNFQLNLCAEFCACKKYSLRLSDGRFCPRIGALMIRLATASNRQSLTEGFYRWRCNSVSGQGIPIPHCSREERLPVRFSSGVRHLIGMWHLLDDHGLSQVITEPTRGDNTLDLFLVNSPSLIIESDIVPGVSDHDCPVITLSLRPNRRKH